MPRVQVVVSVLVCFGSLFFGLSTVRAATRSNTVPPGWPKVLTIPRLGIKAPVEAVAMNRPADTHAPYRWGDVAWYDRGPKPGDVGRAAIFGHLDSTCCPAVFYQLKNARKGDRIQVAYKNGSTVTFVVQWQATYPNAKLPMKFLFGPSKVATLVLWTCTGVFHTDGSGYDHKLVVFAMRVDAAGH